MHSRQLKDMSEIRDALGEHVFRFESRTILIPGGNGFLGRSFTQFFQYLNQFVFRLPCKVIAVDNYIVGANPALQSEENVTRLTHDLTTPLTLKLDRSPIDFIINCAGVASPSAYLNCPLEVMDVSYIGTRNVLELAVSKGSRVINFSSSECYGNPPPEFIPTHESYLGQISSISKRAPYDVGKKTLEAISHIFRSKYGVDVSIVLPFNVYGYMSRNDYRVIPNFVWACIDGKSIQVYKPGTQTRTFCFYTDFVTGVLLVLLKGKEFAYNVGNQDGEVSMENLARAVKFLFSGRIDFIDRPPAYHQEPERRCPDISRVKELGYQPRVSLTEGLQRIKDEIYQENQTYS